MTTTQQSPRKRHIARSQDLRSDPARIKARSYKTMDHDRRRYILEQRALTPPTPVRDIAAHLGMSASRVYALIGEMQEGDYAPPEERELDLNEEHDHA